MVRRRKQILKSSSVRFAETYSNLNRPQLRGGHDKIASSDLGALGEFVVVVGNPNRDRFGRRAIRIASIKLGAKTMHLSNESLLVIIFVGIVAGWLAGRVMEGGGFG
jgi:hypothetical protein